MALGSSVWYPSSKDRSHIFNSQERPMAHKSRLLIVAAAAILLVAVPLVTGLPYGRFGAVNGAWAQTYPGSVAGPGCNQFSDLGFTTSVQDPVSGTFEGGFLMCGYSSVTLDT